jgi:hypothetical protein
MVTSHTIGGQSFSIDLDKIATTTTCITGSMNWRSIDLEIKNFLSNERYRKGVKKKKSEEGK